jgi:hypothetical protein
VGGKGCLSFLLQVFQISFNVNEGKEMGSLMCKEVVVPSGVGGWKEGRERTLLSGTLEEGGRGSFGLETIGGEGGVSTH